MRPREREPCELKYHLIKSCKILLKLVQRIQDRFTWRPGKRDRETKKEREMEEEKNET